MSGSKGKIILFCLGLALLSAPVHSGVVLTSQPQSFKEGLAAVCIDEKWGYIDKTGKIVIKPQFDSVSDFREGLAGVEIRDSGGSGRFGFIDKEGNQTIKAQFSRVGDFHHGLAWACGSSENSNTSECGCIDKTGHFTIDRKYLSIGDFSGPLAPVEVKVGNETKYGFIDTKGKMVTPIQYNLASNMNEGLAWVCIGENHGFIDEMGALVFKVPSDQALNQSFSEGMVVVKVCDEGRKSSPFGKYGFIDRSGKMVIGPRFQGSDSHSGLSDFSEGLAPFIEHGSDNLLYGYIDKTGRVVIKPRFTNVNLFSEGLAAVQVHTRKGFKWGYIDKTGKMVIPPQFGDGGPGDGPAESFSEGLAVVRMDGSRNKFVYIDRNGKVMISEIQM